MKLVLKVNKVAISTEYVTLEARLKLSGATMSGGEAKHAVQNGEAKVNGEVCTQRGRKLRAGDKVGFGGKIFEVVNEG